MWKAASTALATILLSASAVLAQDNVLVAPRISGPLPVDPASPLWDQASPVTIELLGQAVTTPMVLEASINEIIVRTLNDGREIAFRLEWADDSENRFQLISQFSDAVAVQIPFRPSAEVPITMGEKGDRVLILHWAAFRQENIESGYSDISKIYPNYAYDWYPHAEPPYVYPTDWHNQYALNYIGGEKVLRKNTLKTPVREVVAEGFGSSTWKDVQRAEGTGVHRDGKWEVVIKRRFVEENTSNPDWGPDKQTFVTFAAWDGGLGERGPRKALSYEWLALKIEAK